jgi:protein-disulfide isomerase
MMPSTPHPVACEAARAALCAQDQGKFESAYQDLFEKQETFTQGRPLEIMKGIGVDESRIKGCMASPETNSRIAKDVEEANTLGVKSTPTFFLNGHRMEGAYPVPAWNHIIDRLLK